MKTTLTSVAVSALCAAVLAQESHPGVAARMSRFVEDREMAGSVTLVADMDRVLHLDAIGMADIGAKRPMTGDTLFWIASMTKPVTGTAVMMMAEEGKLSLDDSIADHLPEFKDLKDDQGNPVTVTIAQCLTHSS